MAIFYKLHHRENKQHPEMTGYFATVANKGLVETDVIADEIQRNCSMKRSDVLAVLAELSEVLKQQIQQSHSVKLEGIGIFRPGISSKMEKDPKLFKASTHIRGLRLNFRPETFKQGKQQVKAVFAGAKIVQETVPDLKLKPSGPDAGGESGGGGHGGGL